MSVVIDNGERMPVPGIARNAVVSIEGDNATIAVARTEMIAAPRPGQRIQLDGQEYEAGKTLLRTPHVLQFIARRLADG